MESNANMTSPEENSDDTIGGRGSAATSPLVPDSTSTSSSHDGETCSLDQSMKDYPFHFNRRYHKFKEGSYPFPNDDPEQDRMNYQYSIIKVARGGRLFFAPIRDAMNILDVGTGTGIWVLELADSGLFPDAHITGIDLSPIQPDMVPPNVFFEVQDCAEADWARHLGSLDFIYCQSLFGSLADYAQYLITARKYLAQGDGWIECCETDIMPQCDDGSMPDDYGYKAWAEWMEYASNRSGRPFRVANKIKQWMIDAGYTDVQEVITKIPIGTWPAKPELKMVGKAWQALISETFGAS